MNLYFETGSYDPAYNLAFEEYILENYTTGTVLILWQNDKAVIVGRNQNAEEEINRKFVEEHGIRVIRRTSGGGAVYHDLGNVNYSYITDAAATKEESIQPFLHRIIESLKLLGIEAESSGRNDILASGYKVSGTAQRLRRQRILHHGTLLFDVNIENMAEALRVDAEKYKSKSAKSVRSRVTNIRRLLPEDMTVEGFLGQLRTQLSDGFVKSTLSPEEVQKVTELKKEKYDTWEWTFAHSPKYEYTNKKKWPSGILKVILNIEDGRIYNAVFEGDFLSLLPAEEVAAGLVNCPYDRNAVKNKLELLPLDLYFGGITCEQILDTFF